MIGTTWVWIIVDGRQQLFFLGAVAGLAGGVDLAEDAAEFAGVRLAQEGVKLLDQRRHGGLLVHRLVRQRAEIGAERGDHPAGQVEIAALGRAEMLLDGDHLLLADEAVPAAERLGVKGGIGVIGRHVLAHDGGGISGDIETRLEAVLQAHAGHGLGVDAVPSAVLAFDELLHLGNMALIFVGLPRLGGSGFDRSSRAPCLAFTGDRHAHYALRSQHSQRLTKCVNLAENSWV